jgi:hypothetical protein
MKRRIFNVLAGLSALLCVATAGMWVRSYWRQDWICLGIAQQTFGAGFGRGIIEFRTFRGLDSGAGLHWISDRAGNALNLLEDCKHHALGFGLGLPDWVALALGPEAGHVVALPNWLLVVITAVLPGWYLRQQAKLADRRRRTGLCTKCGYDLRATPDRCPECGRVPDKRG